MQSKRIRQTCVLCAKKEREKRKSRVEIRVRFEMTLASHCGLRYNYTQIGLITLVQENNLHGRPEWHVTHVHALAHVAHTGGVAGRTAPTSRHGLVTLTALVPVAVLVAVGAQHPGGHVTTLSQQRRRRKRESGVAHVQHPRFRPAVTWAEKMALAL